MGLPPGVQSLVPVSAPAEQARPFWGADWTRVRDQTGVLDPQETPHPQMAEIMHASIVGRAKALLNSGDQLPELAQAIMADPLLSRIINLTVDGADIPTILAELAG